MQDAPGPALMHTRDFFGRRVVTEAGRHFQRWNRAAFDNLARIAGDEVREQKKARA